MLKAIHRFFERQCCILCHREWKRVKGQKFNKFENFLDSIKIKIFSIIEFNLRKMVFKKERQNDYSQRISRSYK